MSEDAPIFPGIRLEVSDNEVSRLLVAGNQDVLGASNPLDKETGAVVLTKKGLQQKLDGDSTKWTQGISYDGAPFPESTKKYKIYDYVRRKNLYDFTEFPGKINYKTGLEFRLHPTHQIELGELKNTTYYSDAVYSNGNISYSNPILSVDFTWDRDDAGFAWKRTNVISYYFDDETIADEKKTTVKYYDNQASIIEVRRRRYNMSTAAQRLGIHYIYVFHNGAKTYAESIEQGREWALSHNDLINRFVDFGCTMIITEIENSTEGWLTAESEDVGLSVAQKLTEQLTTA